MSSVTISERIDSFGSYGISWADSMIARGHVIVDLIALYQSEWGDRTAIITEIFKTVLEILIRLPFAIAGILLGAPIIFVASFFKPEMVCISPAEPFAPVHIGPTEETPLKVMTFNVSLGLETVNAYGGLTSTAERVDGVAQEILQSNAHIVCVQEGFNDSAARTLSNQLKEKYPYQIFSVAPNKCGLNSGLLMFSQVPLENPKFYKHRTTAGIVERCANKGTLVCQANLGKERIVIANTHLTAFADLYRPGAANARTRQMADWRQTFLPDYKKTAKVARDSLVFQCGDFNSSPQLPHYWPEWTSVIGDDQELETPYATTMPDGNYCHFDHIFIENSPQAANVKGKMTTYRVNNLSDHSPVLGSFQFKDKYTHHQ